MTDEEVEIVAQELAKVGGTSWYPGREPGSILRLVNDRYRDQARALIHALDNLQNRRSGVLHFDPTRSHGDTAQSGLMG